MLASGEIKELSTNNRKFLKQIGAIERRGMEQYVLTAYGHKLRRNAITSAKLTKQRRTPENRARVSTHFTELWRDPTYRARISPSIREGQKKRYFNPGDREFCHAVAKKAWETRRARYGSSGSPKQYPKRVKTTRDRTRMGERVRWGYAWKRLPYVLELLFDPPNFLCSICYKRFDNELGLAVHIGWKHKRR